MINTEKGNEMRMWNVDPKSLCRRHLLGEHVEMHMFVGTIRKGVSMKGYIEGGLVETQNIRKRHDQLAEEMTRRGMNHRSPLVEDYVIAEGSVDVAANLVELTRRCPECAALQRKAA